MISALNHTRALMLGFAFCVAALAPSVHAAGTEAERLIESTQMRRAATLLERAVKHIEEHGESGAADFSREAEFVDRDLYVYALRTDGRFLASGGSSAVLIGENVLRQTDLEGRPFFREIVERALAQGGGQVEYRWFNPADPRGEPKMTSFRRVGEVIVAVGFYPPRATPAQAKALFREASRALSSDAPRALADFQRLDGRFIRDDLYVFVVDLADGRFLAHGASPGLIGSDAHALRDPDGRPIVTAMIDAAKKNGDGEFDYTWRNPTTGRIEKKHTYFRALDGKLIGVGYYNR